MAINKRVTRTILDTTEETLKTQNLSADPLSFQFLTSQFLYVGSYGKFQSRYFDLSTVNATTSVVSVKYWDGSAYVACLDVVDQTNGFTTSGFISWTNQDDWELHQQTGISTGDGTEDEGLYYVEITVSVNLDAGTALQSVTNLYDDNDLSTYYPELVSDTRYLPPNRTSFIDQNYAAKNLVVHKLKQRRTIDDESQIIDINEVNAASTHAAAMIILRPIDQDSEILFRARNAFELEIEDLSKSIDVNKDGIVSQNERDDLGYTQVLRR